MEAYARFVDSIGDSRVKDWPLMNSPLTVVAISVLYWCLSLVWGPYFMRHRKALALKGPLIVYNALNVGLSAWIVKECLMGGWWGEYNFRCQPIDYSPTGMRMARMTWVYFLCKIFDLLDTAFLILGKRDRQVTYLHLYHHGTMPLLAWLSVKFIPGGHATSIQLSNSFVHVIMYTYYTLAALGPRYHKYLWWKKYLTILQLVQFAAMFVHGGQLFVTECDYPLHVPAVGVVSSVYFFYLFVKFYTTAYTAPGRDKAGTGKTK